MSELTLKDNPQGLLRNEVRGYQIRHKLATYEQAYAKAVVNDEKIRKIYLAMQTQDEPIEKCTDTTDADWLAIEKRLEPRLALQKRISAQLSERCDQLETIHGLPPGVGATMLASDEVARELYKALGTLEGRHPAAVDATDDEDAVGEMLADPITELVGEDIAVKAATAKIGELEAQLEALVGTFATTHNLDYGTARSRIAEIEGTSKNYVGATTPYGALTAQIAAAEDAAAETASAVRARYIAAAAKHWAAIDAAQKAKAEQARKTEESGVPGVLDRAVKRYQAAHPGLTYEQAYANGIVDDPDILALHMHITHGFDIAGTEED